MKEIVPTVNGWDRWVMTTFESVEALWDKRWRKWKPVQLDSKSMTPEVTEDLEANPYAVATGQRHQDSEILGEIDVDEEMLSSQGVSRLLDAEERVWENLVDGDNEDEANAEGAVEDGPPPEMQYGDTDSVRGEGSPKSGYLSVGRFGCSRFSHRVFASTHGTPSKSPQAQPSGASPAVSGNLVRFVIGVHCPADHPHFLVGLSSSDPRPNQAKREAS